MKLSIHPSAKLSHYVSPFYICVICSTFVLSPQCLLEIFSLNSLKGWILEDGKDFLILGTVFSLKILKSNSLQQMMFFTGTIIAQKLQLVGFSNWHVSGCQLGEETPSHSLIWLWRLLEPSNLVAPPKKYTFRTGTFIESIFAVDSSFTSAVVAEL